MGAPLKHVTRCLVVTSTLGLVSCGAGGGGSGTPGNIRLESASIASGPVMAGHEVSVLSSLDATQAYADVGLAFFLVNKADLDARVASPRQFTLGGDTVASLPAGLSLAATNLTIPTAITSPGDWVLIAEVDPSGAIAETNETDNSTASARTTVTVATNLSSLPDLVLEQALFLPAAIALDAESVNGSSVTRPDGSVVPNRANPILNVDVTLSVTGSQTLSGVPISVLLNIPDYGQGPSKAGLQFLRVWDNASQSYAFFTTVPPLTEGHPITMHLACAWPEDPPDPSGLRAALDAALRAANQDGQVGVLVAADPERRIAQNEAGSSRFVRSDGKDDWITLPATLTRSITDSVGLTGFSVHRVWHDEQVVPWPQFLNAHTKPPVHTFFEIEPNFQVDATGNSQGLTAVVDGELRLDIFPELNGPLPPAIKMTSTVVATPNAASPYTFTLDLSVYGQRYDTFTVTDFSTCKTKSFNVPFPFDKSVSKDFSDKWISGAFTAGISPSMTIDARACADLVNGLDVQLTNTVSLDVSMGVTIGLPFVRVGPSVNVSLVRRAETDRLQAFARLLPTPGASLTLTHTVKRDHFQGELDLVLELPWFEWCETEVLGHCLSTTNSFTSNLTDWPPLIQPDDVVIFKTWSFP